MQHLTAFTSLNDFTIYSSNDELTSEQLHPLTVCTSLKKIHIATCFLTDCRALAACKQLEDLQMHQCAVGDNYAALSGCMSLKSLTLYGSDTHQIVIDMHILSKYTKIESISINNNIVLQNCSALSLCISLTKLSIHQSDISDDDLREIATSCVRLEELCLFECRNIQDISVLSELKQLKDLNIAGTDMPDLSPLSMCLRLEHVRVGERGLEDVIYLHTCNRLQNLIFTI